MHKEQETEKEQDQQQEEEEQEVVEDISQLTVAVLKSRVKSLGLPTSGKKAALVERLQKQLDQRGGQY